MEMVSGNPAANYLSTQQSDVPFLSHTLKVTQGGSFSPVMVP
jgi:hypothetical protein